MAKPTDGHYGIWFESCMVNIEIKIFFDSSTTWTFTIENKRIAPMVVLLTRGFARCPRFVIL